MITPREFYMGNPLRVARGLLGKYLCRRLDDGTIIRARIAEVELYHQSERACHAYGAKCTARNSAMFLTGGHAYVYLCYGLHNMLNIVLGDDKTAIAVLIRAVEIDGGRGPGALTKRLLITRELNGADLCSGDKLWLENGTRPRKIAVGTRIGIDYAGTDAQLPWRFAIADSPYISRPI